ncbi:DNA polymerase zeta catalytic subunit [Geodia barretti]|uniref:DNA polymerase zeta catalytic subunit n=2 Tax=Geodia barretti TaxID=519541 RepID=A0AA35SM38_GEOBA|nr:DNA polymerase zeta catalytic subunit [Geodia barretti]
MTIPIQILTGNQQNFSRRTYREWLLLTSRIVVSRRYMFPGRRRKIHHHGNSRTTHQIKSHLLIQTHQSQHQTRKCPEKLTSISAGPGGQSSQTTRGYLSGCVSGEGVEVTYVSSESELFEQLVSVVRRHDPDILLGYDVTMMSWGYLIDRAAVLNSNLTNQISRTPHQPDQKPNVDRADSGSRTRPKSSSGGVQIPGRIVVSVWRLLRKELALTSYSFESTFFQVMHQRIPMFPFQTLTQWYENGTLAKRAEVVDYYMLRCHGNYQMLEKLNVIGRTSEFARLYGIEFENVLTRGSQYRVESMLLRLAKPANYIATSPSIQQRARMAALECLPLILEPESKFYSDPVLLLDFQSLYPSIVIGYNYCYTTCLGRLRNLVLHGNFTFGTTTLKFKAHVLKKVKDKVTISPNGVVFVDPTVRRGVMPRMLEEILSTRIMVKGSMKKHAADKALNRMLDARQMGLKLIANVTYGYTAASFSGRMPCVEVADSIVGKARETLERAIKLISATREWRARVVYGATDSVFVLLKGASKEEAFRIGREICDRVTADNPKPIKLKFEKVYYPCILQTKNRYCGYMYETPDQTEPVYDAKGIETVRRDTCPAVAKVLEKSLSLLFSTFDLSQVKSYVQRQLTKLLDGHVSLQDHILAKEYRGRGKYRPSACVPALELARRGVATDPRAEPRPGERVPYVVVYGHPGQPLIQLVRPPLEVAKDPTLRLNGVYYITKQVLPALDRALSLLGVDVYQWYRDLPRVIRAPLPAIQETGDRKLKGTLGQYFATVHCPICNELTNEGLCSSCRGNPQLVATVLSRQIHDIESAHHSVTMLCHSCTRTPDPSIPHQCVSLDCPVLYRRLHTHHTLQTLPNLTRLLDHTTLSKSP